MNSPTESITTRAARRARRLASAAKRRARRIGGYAQIATGRTDIRNAPPKGFVTAAFQIILRRDPDPDGLNNYVTHLKQGTLTPDGVIDELAGSMEFRNNRPYRNTLRALHIGRCDFVQMMPPAKRILDLGGTDQENVEGSTVSMGYPYNFDELIIVDLPHDDRHGLYTRSERADEIKTEKGLVRYEYHSMVDLSQYPDASFDLVISGQSIEHITEEEGKRTAEEAFRVLQPGGWFCVDTPNRRATRVQTGDDMFTNPDHKLEYTAEQLESVLVDAGFEVTGRFGVGFVPESIASGEWNSVELATQCGVYASAEDCYFLAYQARKPLTAKS